MFKEQAKRLEIFVIVAVIALIGIIYALTKQPVLAPTNDTAKTRDEQQQQNSTQQVPTTTITYQGVDGKNALELLKATHNVETKEYSGIGEFVTSIDGVAPDANHFWALYVNGSQTQVGAGSYMTKNGEVIEWKLEEIKM